MDKALGLVGLLYKAHKAYIGAELLAHLDKCRYLLIASDLSSRTALSEKKRMLAMEIPYDESYSMKELGEAVGKPPVSYIGIVDRKASDALRRKLKKGDL